MRPGHMPRATPSGGVLPGSAAGARPCSLRYRHGCASLLEGLHDVAQVENMYPAPQVFDELLLRQRKDDDGMAGAGNPSERGGERYVHARSNAYKRRAEGEALRLSVDDGL